MQFLSIVFLENFLDSIIKKLFSSMKTALLWKGSYMYCNVSFLVSEEVSFYRRAKFSHVSRVHYYIRISSSSRVLLRPSSVSTPQRVPGHRWWTHVARFPVPPRDLGLTQNTVGWSDAEACGKRLVLGRGLCLQLENSAGNVRWFYRDFGWRRRIQPK